MWMDRLEAEHDNLRAALEWFLDADEPELAVRLTGALWHFWFVRGHLREGGQWLDRALTARRPPQRTHYGTTPRAETPALAKALTGAGVLAHYRAEYRVAAALCGEGLALSRRIEDPASVAAALDGLALVARAGGNYAAARAMYREATEILESLEDIAGLSYTLCYLATTLWLEADYASARPIVERALSLARELGDQQVATSALCVLSFVTCSQGDAATAEALAVRALAQLEGFVDRRGTARAEWALANALVLGGRDTEALPHYLAALTITRDINDHWFVPWCLVGLAEVALHTGDPERAVRLLGGRSVLWEGDVVPCLRLQMDRTLAAARAALTEPSRSAAWESGRRLTAEEIAAEALAVEVPDAVVASAVGAAGARPPITARELEVAALIARGLTNKQIATELVIAEGTAERHVANILSKLGFTARAQVAAWVVRRGV
jgi:ATP/maltotriose-dependent transcriptional regulator MalT